MGLDCYLKRDERLTEGFDKVDVRAFVDDNTVIRKGVKNPYLTTEAAYWRKANQIHNWFVENIQDGEDDCRRYYVSRAQLKQLYDLCDKILKAKGKERTRLAKELLPTREGFFFGSTDYDDDYYEDLKNTCEQLEPILKEDELPNVYYYYNSSW